MPLSVADLREHFSYSAWASQRLVHAAAELTEDELHRDFQTADRSVFGTLVHTFGADRIWLARFQQAPVQPYLTDADRHMDVLVNQWPELYRQWNAWFAGQTDEALCGDLVYKDMKGNVWTNTIWKLAMHVVNHGTHHRGQASGFLRTMGHTPPALDLVAYYQLHATAQAV
ncbi:MAG: DinB family protein [Candidatus Solibacter sp.]